ncbi:MAG: protein kinase, partial [Nocardioides sp.]|nr:protein kinase [Nocardioides sp.]
MTTTPGQRAPEGMSVGDYTLLARIGEGGMGVVHLASKPGGARVALKVLRPQIIGDDEARQRLDREVNSLSRVRSPRVAEIVDSDPWGPIPFVATRYVPGLSLHDHIREEGPVAGEDLLHFARGLAEAIAAVHEVGVLHRDIKPSNVLMEGRNPVLIDFGLARVADDANITRTGWLLGTPGYLAPEILYGHEPTAAADVHSWAATVAFAGLGRPPFGKGPSVAVMDRVRRGEHDLDGLGHEVLGPVLQALDPDPVERPSLPSLIRMLGGIHGGDVPASGSTTAPPTMTMPMVAASDYTPTDRVEEREPEAKTMAPSYSPYQAPPAPDPTRSEQQEYPPATPRTPLLERMRRWLLGGGLLAVTTGAVVLAPYLTSMLIVVVVTCLRAISLGASAHSGRRSRRGAKWYDGTLTVITAPWNFLVSLPATIMLLAWVALLVGCVGLIMIVLGVSEIPALSACGVTLGVGLWTGPGGSRLRSPIERVGFPITAKLPVWLVGVLLLFALAAGLVAYASSVGVEWSPFQNT